MAPNNSSKTICARPSDSKALRSSTAAVLLIFGLTTMAAGQNNNSPKTFQALSPNEVYVLGSNGNMWLEHAPFGSVIPPARQQVDGNVQTFQGLTDSEALVLGTDGKLWLEHAPFGNSVPPARQQVDGNVRTFQALSPNQIYVLGTDSKLWLEDAPFGNAVPPARRQVDGNVRLFEALSATEALVLGTDGKLWLEHSPFGNVPPARQQVDGNVQGFQALSVTEALVLGTDGKLWLEQGPFGNAVPPARQQVDGNVRSFQGLSANEVFALGTDGNLWLEHGPFGNVPPARQQVDGNVHAFQGFDSLLAVVLGTDAKLWLEFGPFGIVVPPIRDQIDGNVAPGQPQLQTELYRGHEVVPNEVLVRLTIPGSVPATFSRLLRAEDIDSVKGVGSGVVLRLHSRSKTAAALINDLSTRPEVVDAGPNSIYHLHSTASCRLPNPVGIPDPPDPRPICPDFWKLWGIYNVGQNIPLSEAEKSNYGEAIPGVAGADSEALLAWSYTTGTSFTGSEDNVVAVLDSGIDYTNPALMNNMWSAPGPFTVTIGGQPGQPNSTTITCSPSPAIPVLHGYDFVSNTCDPQDQFHHGTHVAGIIGANGGPGIVGMSPIASIMALRVCDEHGRCIASGLQDGIEFAIQMKKLYSVNVRVLNYSAGGGSPSPGDLDAINNAGDNDMLLVASAGNDGTDNDTSPVYPASYPATNLVAVAATDNGDLPATFAHGGTNYGSKSVHLGAPGQDIYSTWPASIPCPNASLKAPFTPSPGYCWDSGTSMAAPFVSGAAALVLSRCPGLSATALKTLIVNNVDKTGLQTVSQGRLNVSKAINACQ